MAARSQAMPLALLFFTATWSLVADAPANAQSQPQTKTAAKAKGADFQLAYRFVPGEVVRNSVVHLATVDTKMRGIEGHDRMRSASIRSWKILSVNERGEITFATQVDEVDMWQQSGDGKEIRYRSRDGAEPPAVYQHVAGLVGVELATVTIDARGRVLERKNAREQFNPGIGELTIPLPKERVSIGDAWYEPDEVAVRLTDGTQKRIKLRQKYQLLKVETGVAVISVRTEVLTPVDDPKVQSQLVQRLTHGVIRFDLDAGRLRSKQVDLDETVVGFSGPDSMMEYVSRLTEEIVPPGQTAIAELAPTQEEQLDAAGGSPSAEEDAAAPGAGKEKTTGSRAGASDPRQALKGGPFDAPVLRR